MKKVKFRLRNAWYPIQVKDLRSDRVLIPALSSRQPEQEILVTEDELELEFRQGLLKKTRQLIDLRTLQEPFIDLTTSRFSFLLHRWVLPLYVVLAFVPRFVLSEEAYDVFEQWAYMPLGVLGLLIMLRLIYENTLGRADQLVIDIKEASAARV